VPKNASSQGDDVIGLLGGISFYRREEYTSMEVVFHVMADERHGVWLLCHLCSNNVVLDAFERTCCNAL